MPTNYHQTDEEATTGDDVVNGLRGAIQVDEGQLLGHSEAATRLPLESPAPPEDGGLSL